MPYKAFMDGTRKCGKGPSLLEKQHEPTRDQIHRARQLREDLIREDLCDEDHISASQDQDAPGSPQCLACLTEAEFSHLLHVARLQLQIHDEKGL